MSPLAHAGEVGIPLEVEGEVGGDVGGEAVVELHFEVEVGLEDTALEPVHVGEVGPGFVGGGEVVFAVLGFGEGAGIVDKGLNIVPSHVRRFLIVVEELEAGVEIEAGEDVLLEVLRLDVATEGEVGVGPGAVGVGGVEALVLDDTVGVAGVDEVVVEDEGGLAGQEREGDGPVGFLVLEGESGGEVGGSEEGGDHLALVVAGAGILITGGELSLEVGGEAGAPVLVGLPGDGGGEVYFIEALADALETATLGGVVKVLPCLAEAEVHDVVPHILGMGVLVVAEEGEVEVDLRRTGGGPVVEHRLTEFERRGGEGGPRALRGSVLRRSGDGGGQTEGRAKSINAFHCCKIFVIT